MSIIHWPVEKPAIVEAEEERDRRDCIALDKKVDGANRELGQWLLAHPSYGNTEVAQWLGCDESRVRRLRKWAVNGFRGTHYDRTNAPRSDNSVAPPNAPLKTHDNFQDDTWEPSEEADDGIGGVEDPKQILWHLIDTIKGQQASAEAYRKIFKKSSFDREAKAKIYNAINQLIVKWRTVQSALDTKGQGNGSKSEDN
jgi:hypothetical protein